MPTIPARFVAAACLVTTALLSTVSVMLQPEFVADPAERLAAMDESGTSGTISLLAFVFSQLPFLVAVVSIALLARAASPRLSVAGGILATVGGFGHAVFGGVALAFLAMSSDAAERAAMAEVITRVESGPALIFMASGMLGTVIGLVLLSAALFRSRVVPRWVPLALWAFLAMEFVVSNFTAWASPAGGLLYLAAFSGVAVQLVRGDAVADQARDELVGAQSAGS